jgi:Tfp pilus assembly protein PilX
MRRPFPKFSRGAIALVALCFVSVLGLVLAGYFAISQQSMRLSSRSYGATVSEQLAELGLEEALRAITTNNFADWTSGTAPDQTNVDGRHRHRHNHPARHPLRELRRRRHRQNPHRQLRRL